MEFNTLETTFSLFFCNSLFDETKLRNAIEGLNSERYYFNSIYYGALQLHANFRHITYLALIYMLHTRLLRSFLCLYFMEKMYF